MGEQLAQGNTAVALARGFTATFAGISLGHVAPFIAAQVAGAALGAYAEYMLSGLEADRIGSF